MNTNEIEQKKLLIQDFRYSVIAELGNPYLEPGELSRLIKEKAKRTYQIPFSTKTAISRACIKKWYLRYKKYGKEALLPAKRNDTGKCKVLPDNEKEILLEELENNKHLTAATVVRKLQKEGKIKSEVSKSALSRLTIAAGLDKKARRKAIDESQNLKFDFFYPLECIQADCLHGFLLPDAKGRKRKTILLAFIDDATRRILYAEFSFTECSLEFEKGIMHILKSHGRIACVYVDNGSTFVSNQTKRILDILKIHIAHSTPYRPKGRGKIERFFRTLRDQFLSPLDITSIKSLDDLNMRLHTWLETEYHRSPHSGLDGQTPLDAWMSKCKYIITVDPSVDIDRVFFHDARRRVYNDNTFTLNGYLYEVPLTYKGSTIKVVYNPHLPVPRPIINADGKDRDTVKLVDSYANSKVKRNKSIKHGTCEPSVSLAQIQPAGRNISVKATLSAAKINLSGEER
ncbi:MAG: transposase [Desulfobacteraceae bacterium]|nr:MAG: transposase [Desulfobacteraceae bacterium]